jgi:hypothetical protein
VEGTERAHHCNRGGCVLWSAESGFPFPLYIWHSHSASNHPCGCPRWRTSDTRAYP